MALHFRPLVLHTRPTNITLGSKVFKTLISGLTTHTCWHAEDSHPGNTFKNFVSRWKTLLHLSDFCWFCSAYLKEGGKEGDNFKSKLDLGNTCSPQFNLFCYISKQSESMRKAHSRIFMQTQKPVEHASGLSVDAKKRQHWQGYRGLPGCCLGCPLVLQVFYSR